MNRIHNKKAVTPLISTVLLIIFAAMLGVVVMSWGTTYVEADSCSSVTLSIEDENGVIRIVPKVNNIPCDEKSIEINKAK